jgi:hypothetical protein
MSNECKANNVLTIFEDAIVGARGTKALAALANSPMHPKAKLHPS